MKKSEPSSDNLRVTGDQASAFRLSRHHLLERAPRRALLAAAHSMGGAQAQLLPAAQISLWARVRDLRPEDVDKAMRERSLVKASCMRNTLFLVPSSDLPVLSVGAARRGEREIRWALKKGVPGNTLEAAMEAALSVLGEPLTRPEIAERLSAILGVRQQPVRGGGWGHRGKITGVTVGRLIYPVVDLLHLAAARGVICYGPTRGSEPTFVRADAWLPQWRASPREQAEGSLLRIYLRAFGPATAQDFAMWSGFTFKEARAILGRMREELEPIDLEGREAFILKGDLKELAQAGFHEPSVRLLPHFDTFLLGHWERDHLIDMEHRLHVYRPQGWIAPVVLLNGRVIGLWERVQEGGRLHINITKFEPIPRGIRIGIREEAQDLGRFLGLSDAKVVIG